MAAVSFFPALPEEPLQDTVEKFLGKAARIVCSTTSKVNPTA